MDNSKLSKVDECFIYLDKESDMLLKKLIKQKDNSFLCVRVADLDKGRDIVKGNYYIDRRIDKAFLVSKNNELEETKDDAFFEVIKDPESGIKYTIDNESVRVFERFEEKLEPYKISFFRFLQINVNFLFSFFEPLPYHAFFEKEVLKYINKQ